MVKLNSLKNLERKRKKKGTEEKNKMQSRIDFGKQIPSEKGAIRLH